ncbi:MAG: sigma-54 dependent transcriptional regulator [PVC group bacterium]
MAILLVNHDKTELGRWREDLRQWGVPARYTREGFTALQMVVVEDISAVICRADLPLISGLTLSRMLKKGSPGMIVVLAAPAGRDTGSLSGKTWDLGPIALSGPEFQKVIGSLLLADGSLLREGEKSLLFSGPPDFEEIIGLSPRMGEIFSLIHKVRDQDVTVLIQGESGTGKELIARALHRHSRRSNRAFVSVNCAAIPENLLESELFGHEKGAFTGADSLVVGRFEQADCGCIFMDEIGDMSPATQAKVLRVFEGHDFERVGGREKITVDVRIIAATNRDLEEQVAEGSFREDLFYRLSAFPLTLPSLDERMEDLPLLAAHILREHNRTADRKITSVTLKAMEKLLGYHWPGNIRHLENVIKRAAILAAGGAIDAEHVQPERRRALHRGRPGDAELPSPEEPPPVEAPSIRSLAEVEKEAIESALQKTSVNISRAAAALGISRATLYKKAKEYGIEISR